MSEKKIKILKDGPYIVSGNIPLDKKIIGIGEDNEPHEYLDGEKFANEESYALCRCGNSKNKPFCDHSHVVAGFDGSEITSNAPFLDQAQTFEGPTLILKDAASFCSGARFCHPQHGVWRLTRSSDDLKSRIQALKESFNCPSGRLVHINKEDGKILEPELEMEISLIEDPQSRTSLPIWVKGGIPIEGNDGRKYETRNRVTLCRCGKSENKPFCDGTHMRTGFDDGDISLTQ